MDRGCGGCRAGEERGQENNGGGRGAASGHGGPRGASGRARSARVAAADAHGAWRRPRDSASDRLTVHKALAEPSNGVHAQDSAMSL